MSETQQGPTRQLSAADAPEITGICPEHGLRPVRWIEGAHRCDECGEACTPATHSGAGDGPTITPEPRP